MCSMGKNMNFFLSKKTMVFLELGNFHGHPNIEYRVRYIHTHIYIYTHTHIHTLYNTRTHTHTYIYIYLSLSYSHNIPIIFPMDIPFGQPPRVRRASSQCGSPCATWTQRRPVLGVWRHRQQMGLGWLEDDGDNQTTTWCWVMLGVLSVGRR